jgi:hypothetical protein
MKSVLLAVLLLSITGRRGPLAAPAFRRLDPDEQAQVDRMWDNALQRPDRLDRELLLDVIIAFQLHASGVDRATYHAEKSYAQGTVVMDVRFDRNKPLDDWFFLEVHDPKGNVVRKEHYAGDEVWSHLDQLTGFELVREAAATQPAGVYTAATQPITPQPGATQPATMPSEAELREAQLTTRYLQIIAATQPMKP